jgi:hypothetical protein
VSFVDVKNERKMNNKRGGYVYSDESESESDKTYPPLLLFIFLSFFTSTNAVDVKSESKMNNKRGGYVLSDSDSDSSEYRRHKKKTFVSFVDVKASVFTEVLICFLLYSNESEESDESDEYL